MPVSRNGIAQAWNLKTKELDPQGYLGSTPGTGVFPQGYPGSTPGVGVLHFSK